MSSDDRPWCEAVTTAQAFGASWASSKQGCPRRATETVHGEQLCKQHARIARAAADQG